MANCLITSGWAQDCITNTGGLRTVFLANVSSVATIEPAVGATTDQGIITSMTMAAPLGVTASFYEYKPNKMSSKFDETGTSNPQNGTFEVVQTITLMFSKNEAAKRNQVKLMAASDLVAIVQDFNGKYWYVGEFNGLSVGANFSTGTAGTDMNGWTITLTGNSNEPAREVDPAVIASIS